MPVTWDWEGDGFDAILSCHFDTPFTIINIMTTTEPHHLISYTLNYFMSAPFFFHQIFIQSIDIKPLF